MREYSSRGRFLEEAFSNRIVRMTTSSGRSAGKARSFAKIPNDNGTSYGREKRTSITILAVSALDHIRERMWSSGISAREARFRAARTRSWRTKRSSTFSLAYLEAPLAPKVRSGWDFAVR